MYFFSHLYISRVLYRNFKKEVNLSKLAFAYGNVKPDLPPACFRDKHTMDNYLFIVYDKTNQLLSSDPDVKEFSVILGELCHFVCDFFCYYHLNDRLYKKMLSHFFYEIRLHLKLCAYRFGNKIRMPEARTPQKGLAHIIFEMRREYFSNPRSIKKDIDFAFRAAFTIFKRIIYLKEYAPGYAWQAGVKKIFPA
jgi:hypothetical protein